MSHSGKAPAAMRCETCIYWSRESSPLATANRNPASAQDRGTCQVAPPELVAVGGFSEGVWPVTHESRFCGAWTQEIDWDSDAGGGGDRSHLSLAQ